MSPLDIRECVDRFCCCESMRVTASISNILFRQQIYMGSFYNICTSTLFVYDWLFQTISYDATDTGGNDPRNLTGTIVTFPQSSKGRNEKCRLLKLLESFIICPFRINKLLN